MKTILITGKGRSGTTWLAQILNTYVHCTYKHEPLLPSKDTPWLALRHGLGNVDATALRRKYASLMRTAVHGVDVPPFPAKSVYPRNRQTMRALYVLGNRFKPLRRLFEFYARPHMHPAADVLIKSVNFPTEQLALLCDVLEPYLIPIVRNPFANIASHLKGVKMGYFAEVGQPEQQRVRALVTASDDPSIRAYADRIGDLTPLQFEAVRWRLQVEPLIVFSKHWKLAHLVVYEDLCENPLPITEALFSFAGWELGDATREFLTASTAGERSQRGEEKAFYGVYRDPKLSMNKWKTQLDASQQAEISSIFRDSPHRGLWRDLPV